jgi:hypothetical protein
VRQRADPQLSTSDDYSVELKARRRTARNLLVILFVVAGLGAAGRTGTYASPASSQAAIQAPGVTYYVNRKTGNNANAGTRPGSAWKTLAKASSATLAPGDRLLLKRGVSWRGSLRVAESGTLANPILVGAYGVGKRPRITGASSCVVLSGSYVVARQLHADDCSWAGFDISGSHNRVLRTVATNNVAGVQVRDDAADNAVLRNTIKNNDKMFVLTRTPTDDDTGAYGVLLQGDGTEVARNRISGSHAFSYDYGRDGSAIEVFGARNSNVHHNRSRNNLAFTELGSPKSADNTYAYNVVRSSLGRSVFLITRGSESTWGPILGTRALNNSVLLTGASSEGVVCHSGCSGDILTLRNNVIQAVSKVGYADADFNESNNLFYGGLAQFSLGLGSLVANPRFSDPSAGDLHLKATSPAIDAGVDVGLSRDFDGRSVPQDGDGDGRAVPDMGAFERRSATGGGGGGGGDFVVVAAGDVACPPPGTPGAETCHQQATADVIESIGPAKVLMLGDAQYETGTLANLSAVYDSSWGAFKAKTLVTAGGSHDFYGGGDFFTYFGTTSMPRGAYKPYSYDLGNWHIISMNSYCENSNVGGCGTSGSQYSWLQADLEANTKPCILAMWHEPYWTSGYRHNNDTVTRPYLDLLYEHRADVLLAGHEHEYERFFAQLPDGTRDASGIRAFVVGTGGKSLESDWGDIESNSAARQRNTFGVLKLNLHSSSYGWEFVPEPGKTYSDSGSASCH